MTSKKTVLKKSDIYAIVDIQTAHKKNLAHLISNLIQNCVCAIQLRDKKSSFNKTFKKALSIKRMLDSKALFIVNDSLALCLFVNADGVHLGQDDPPLSFARKVLGEKKIVGISCHTLKQAKAAQRDGADYIGYGPLFSTPTKKEYAPIGTKDLPELKKLLRIPFFVIGGIDQENLEKIKAPKIKRIAVCRALCHSNNIKKTTAQLRNYLN